MRNERKLPPATEGKLKTSQTNPTNKPLGKLGRMLRLFSKGLSMNTYQAKEEGDTCLHTTVSSLQARHAISFSRKRETVGGRFGPSRVMRYWLEGDSLAKAQAIVGRRAKP